MKKAWMLMVIGCLSGSAQGWAASQKASRSPAITQSKQPGGVYGKIRSFRNWVIHPASYAKTSDGIAINQHFTRRVYTHMGSYTIAEMTFTRHSKTPEMTQFYTVDDMADAMSEGMGISWDTKTFKDGVHTFRGNWEKGNRIITLYIRDEEKYLTTSVAYTRTGYYGAVSDELALVQKAIVLPRGVKKSALIEKFLNLIILPAEAQIVVPPELIDAIGGIGDALEGIDIEALKISFEKQSEAWRADAAAQSDQWRTSFENTADKFNTTLKNITKPENLAKMAFGVTFGAVLGAATANMLAEGVKLLVKSTAAGIHELITKEKHKARVRETVEKFKKLREDYEKLIANAVAIEKILDSLIRVASDEAAEKDFSTKLNAFAGTLDRLRVQYSNDLYASNRRRDALNPNEKDFDAKSCVLTGKILAAEDKLKDFKFITDVFSENLRRTAPACAALMKYFDTLILLETELEKMRALLLNKDTLNYFLDEHYIDREMIEDNLDELQDELPDLKKRQLKRIREMESNRVDRYEEEKGKEIEKCEEKYKDDAKFNDVVSLKRELRSLREQKEALTPTESRDPKRVHSELFQQKWSFLEVASSPLKFTAQSTEDYSMSGWLAKMFYRTEICRLAFDVTVADRTPADPQEAKIYHRQPNFLYEKRTQEEYRKKVGELAQEYDRSIANTAQGYKNYRNANIYPQVELSLMRKYISQLTSDQSCYISNDCNGDSKDRITRASQRIDLNQAVEKCKASEDARR